MAEPITSFTGTYNFLSNFFPCHIEVDDIWYPSVEHAFQAAKTLDREEKLKIANASMPGEAKRLGRKVKLREDWQQVKESIMFELLRLKFKDERLAYKLLATGNVPLIEGNRHGDTEWGVCNGVGQNKLGRLLEKVRSELQGNLVA